MKRWLFRLLFPKHDRAMRLEELRDESVWVRKFAELDADYAELVKDMQDLRAENAMLREQLNKLLLRT